MCEEVGLVLVRSRKHPVFPVPACGCGVSVLNSKFVSDLTLTTDTAQYTSDMCVCVCVYICMCVRGRTECKSQNYIRRQACLLMYLCIFFLVFFL